ncbi:MAG: ankyrin repeat domain-containing protein, partial [bacterium]
MLLLLVSLALVAFWEVVEDQGLGDIFRAVYQDRTDEVRTLLERDPGLANALSKGNMNPLHIAAAKGGIEIVRPLVAAGADVITRTLNGTTPL